MFSYFICFGLLLFDFYGVFDVCHARHYVVVMIILFIDACRLRMAQRRRTYAEPCHFMPHAAKMPQRGAQMRRRL